MSEVADSICLANMPCIGLHGVGAKMVEKLVKLGIRSVQDLLFHLPSYYQDRTRIRPIPSLRMGDQALIEGEIVSQEKPKGGKTRLLLQLHDDRGFIHLRFFHVVLAQLKTLVPGVRLRCFGEVRMGAKGWEMTHPEYQVIYPEDVTPLPETLTPVYPTTEGLYQKSLRRLTEQALSLMTRDASLNLLPKSVLQGELNVDIYEALLTVHRPPVNVRQDLLEKGQHPAQQRLAFEELLAHRLSLLMARQKVQSDPAPIFGSITLQEKLIAQLPFSLTSAQSRALAEVNADLNQSRPMLRLIQGDVGCGKTVVAALAALRAIDAGYQVAVMAPTEILTEQHYRNFAHWCEPLGVDFVMLVGSQGAKTRRDVLEKIAGQERLIVMGTHALFQKQVRFKKLGLVIVDEQHRFGVEQRLQLREKGKVVGIHAHQLIMTATPIPRTLAQTAYADLDQSIIDELPPGRKPVKTVVIGNHKRNDVVVRVQEACLAKKQAYWVCTLIEESERLQLQAAENTALQLKKELPELKVALVHGRLKPAEKEIIMQSFKNGEVDLLVATTVIEVGVDVPNANLMIIENPERLGLSQLHQLRGRVGRGGAQSFCVLMYQQPLSKLSQERLKIMRDYADGFVVAEKDLAIRGPGELLGTKQAGSMQFQIADIVRDQKLIPSVQQSADQLQKTLPALVQPLMDRWLGHRTIYREV